MTWCGETSERRASLIHGKVSVLYLLLIPLYVLMLIWHAGSLLTHWRRRT